MKILSAGAIIVGFIVMGYMIANYYKKRSKFFEDLLYFCDLLTNEINFMQHKLSAVIDSHLESFGVEFKKVLELYKGYLANKITKENFEQRLKNINVISQEEACDIFKFFVNLGGLDVENELANIKNYKANFIKYSDHANHDKAKYMPLFIKLGFIFGCMVVIVLI